MLKDKDLRFVEKLPTKEERLAEKKQRAIDQKNAKIVQDLCIDFFNKELDNLDIPNYLVEEVVTASFRALFSIKRNKSKIYEKFFEAKRISEESTMKELYAKED